MISSEQLVYARATVHCALKFKLKLVSLSYCTSVGAEEAVGVEGLEVPSTWESVASEEELVLVCGEELELLVVPFTQF